MDVYIHQKTKAEKFIDTLEEIWSSDPKYSPLRLIAQCNSTSVAVRSIARIPRGTLYECPDGSQFFLSANLRYCEEREPLRLIKEH